MDRRLATAFPQRLLPTQPIAPCDLLRRLEQTQFAKLLAFFRDNGGRGYETDLVQQTFLKLHRRLKRNPTITRKHAANLLWTVAARVLIDHHRWAAVREPELRPRVTIAELAERHPTAGDNPADRAAERELLDFLKDSMEGPDRKVMEALLQRVQGDPWKDVAAALRVSIPTAPKRLARAFARLVVRMADDRRLDGTLLDALESKHGRLAKKVMRLWIRGKTPKQIAAKLACTSAEAEQLRDNVQAFFAEWIP